MLTKEFRQSLCSCFAREVEVPEDILKGRNKLSFWQGELEQQLNKSFLPVCRVIAYIETMEKKGIAGSAAWTLLRLSQQETLHPALSGISAGPGFGTEKAESVPYSDWQPENPGRHHSPGCPGASFFTGRN